MPETNDQIDELQTRLDNLVRTQIDFQKEVSFIRSELVRLRSVGSKQASDPASGEPKPIVSDEPKIYRQPPSEPPPRKPATEEKKQHEHAQSSGPSFGYEERAGSRYSSKFDSITASAKSDLEKFIGENLLSKVGILILVLGVAIGAKYAIDQGWITPIMRIVFGYVFGFGLIGFAIRLKPKYHNFSAVLLSGGMAIMYFITYFAYSLYQLLNQSSAFALMLIFTVFTVATAINYSRQIIAHLGLVGAYAIPFLLSDDSGRYAFLFIYIAIINAGILAISLKKYWKPLFYTSFIFTWAIYYGWFTTKYSVGEHFGIALLFLTMFFLIFYATFLGYKLLSNENIAVENISLILANSFIFFGFGYVILDRHGVYDDYLGLFTVLNAAIHLTFAFAASRMQKVPSDILYLLAALVLTFVTIAIPIQFDGEIITLIWSAEAVILFWLGRTKQLPLFEYYSYPLIVLAVFSLINDWVVVYEYRLSGDAAQLYRPFFNGVFVTGLFYAAALAVIYFVNKDERFEPPIEGDARMLFKYAVAGAAIVVLYNVFRIEIGNYFHLEISATRAADRVSTYGTTIYSPVYDIENVNVIWQIDYTLLFLSVVALVNLKKIRNAVLSVANVGFLLLAITIFSTAGLYLLAELRDSYLHGVGDELFSGGIFHILIRYVSLAFLATAVYAIYRYSKVKSISENIGEENVPIWFDCFFYLLTWVLLSSELINWMALFGFSNSYKLGLSILWGIYALLLAGMGIYQTKKYLRMGAIGLFGFTLAKVFLYDIADLDTISKTVVFVSLGILILIVAFLYNKYTSRIFESGGKTPPDAKDYEST